MPEQPISQQQLDLMADILGGLYGEQIFTLLQQPPQAPAKSIRPSPFGKSFTKGGSGSGSTTAITVKKPHGPKVKPPEPIKVPSPTVAASAQRPSRPADITPLEPPTQAPNINPPPEQHQLLQEVKTAAQHYDKPNVGTELAHWLRTHYSNRSITTQFEAAGVTSLDDLTLILNRHRPPQGAVNLDIFHDDNSPFAIISEPRETLEQGGIPAVVVGPPYAGQVHILEQAFPGVHFMAVDEAAKELEEAAAKLQRPLPNRVKSSPFGRKKDYTKAQEPATKPQNSPQEASGADKPASQPRQTSQEPHKVKVGETESPIDLHPETPPNEGRVVESQSTPPEASPAEVATPVNAPLEEPPPPQEQKPVIPLRQTDEEVLEKVHAYAIEYKTTRQTQPANYSEELPDDAQVASGDYEPVDTGAINTNPTGKLVINDKTYFTKGLPSAEKIQNEVLASQLGRIAGVPIPSVRKIIMPEHPGQWESEGILMPWLNGDQLMEVLRGVRGIHYYGYGMDFLDQVVKPNSVDLHILFAYQAGMADRHLRQYMISGGELVAIDHEMIYPDVNAKTSRLPNNDLFSVLKYEHLYGTSPRRPDPALLAKIPLSRELAHMLASKGDEIIDAWVRSRPAPKEIDNLRKRTEILHRFSQDDGHSDSGTYGAFVRIETPFLTEVSHAH